MNYSPIPKRASGLLVHITSLPSRYGIGDIGSSSYDFIDYLVKAGQSYWQFLPVVPTSSAFDNSPYMSSSAFAGSPLLLSPDLLYQEGLINQADIESFPAFSDHCTKYDRVAAHKMLLLEKAYMNFDAESNLFREFINESPWVMDYALFMTIKERNQGKSWIQWPEKLARRDTAALNEFKKTQKKQIYAYLFEQYEFFRQWKLLRTYANNAGIKLFGDIPIYVGLDSADVWANQDIFNLDSKSLEPTHVSGVPPDYFSETGQRWGNPLYQWHSDDPLVQKNLLSWWAQRFKCVFDLVDLARIDHFRGFESYWSIPQEEETAINGKWLPGPGKEFFAAIFDILGPLDIVAEDLGIITEDVNKLKKELGFPGMKVLQFAFDHNEKNSFLPWNFTTPHSVIYTGTHDNDTTLGWFLSDKVSEEIRQRIKHSANAHLGDQRPIHHDLIYLALSSSSILSIFPIQDLFGFGNDCRMNVPGTSEGNWSWRCPATSFTEQSAAWLKEKTELFGRGRTSPETIDVKPPPTKNPLDEKV